MPPLLLSILLAAQVSIRPPEAVVRQYYQDKVAGDAAAAAALWVDGAAARTEVAALARARCTRLLGLTVGEAAVDGDRAVVHANAILGTISAMPGAKEAIQSDAARFTLRRGAEGWRIAERKLDAAADAERIANARADDRAAMLRDPALVRPEVASQLCVLALAQINRSNMRDAESLEAAAEEIAAATGDERALSEVRGVQSILFRRGTTPDPDRSMAAAREGLAHGEAAGDPDAIASAYLRMGRAQRMRESYVMSPWFARAAELADYLLDPTVASYAAGEMAQANDHAGNFSESGRWAQLAVHYAELSGKLLPVISAEMNVAGRYFMQGYCDLAAPHYRRILELSRAADFLDGVTESTIKLAQCGLADPTRPHLLERVLAEFGPRAGPEFRADLLADIGERKRVHGDFAGAEKALTRGLREAEESKNASVLAKTSRYLAGLRLDQHRGVEALALVRRAAELEQGIRHTMSFTDLVLEAAAYRELRRYRDAVADLRRAAVMSEDERSNTGSLVGRERFLSLRLQAYTDLAENLVRVGDPTGALFAADWSKARMLLDALQRSDPGAPGRAAEEVLRGAAVNDSDDLMRAVAPGTAVIEFVEGNRNMIAFTIRRDAGGAVRIRAHRVPATLEQLLAAVSAYVRRLSRRELAYTPLSPKLYRWLLAPLASELAGARVLCIIPDSVLWKLPFESLMNANGRFVGERFACFYAPSLAAQSAMRAEKHSNAPQRAFLAFANPIIGQAVRSRETLRGTAHVAPLPDSEREVKAAARHFDSAASALYIGPAASETRAKTESGAYRVVHFATHAQFDDGDPMHSYLVLTPAGDDDGMLETREMMGLRLNADLVVLSACDTARGAIHSGEGVIGMTWALFMAGCPSVIATQWKIASADAADLMIAFYADWRRRSDAPNAKAEALRTARLQLMKKPATRHPFYWAPFIVIGVP